ncbi:YfiR family protein [Dasania marina]|uniref:YfiR family protein n=1 Tax=Dasania marina TaxID=471499 RepID=UPI00035EE9E2|nr:YfiR family protein [Dasania marina]
MRRRVVSACSILLISFLSVSWADNVSVETRIKAAFLYKFCSYIRWPSEVFANSDDPVIMLILGDDVLAAELEYIVADRLTEGRSFSVYRGLDSVELTSVQLVYMAGVELSNKHKIISQLALQPVVTVTELVNQQGPGIINFIKVDNRMRFDVFQARAQKANLSMDSQLLTVARQVIRESP